MKFALLPATERTDTNPKLGPDEITSLWLEQGKDNIVRLFCKNRCGNDWILAIDSQGQITHYPHDAKALGLAFLEGFNREDEVMKFKIREQAPVVNPEEEVEFWLEVDGDGGLALIYKSPTRGIDTILHLDPEEETAYLYEGDCERIGLRPEIV